MRRCAAWLAVATLGAAGAACGGMAGESAPSAGSPASSPAQGPALAPPAPSLPISGTPDIDLTDANAATVHGSRVTFDGIEEGLAWPALERAMGPRQPGEVVTIQVGRAVPMIALLRAAWTVRVADVHVQSQDAAGVMHAVELRGRRHGAPPVSGCHLAVFLRTDGSLRVAAPGGPRDLGGGDPAASLARSLDLDRARCPIAYVAFGAESDAAPFGPVFDVMLAVDRAKSAGDARYVLAQAMHESSPPR